MRNLFALVVLFLLPVSAFATEVPSSTAPSLDSLAVLLITTVSAAAVSLATAGVKKLAPKIPRALLPTLVIPTLGVFAEWVSAYATGGNFSPVVAALVTAGALYLRETLDTLKEHGAAPIEP